MLEESNNKTENLSEGGSAGMMGLVQWKKAPKSEVGSKDKHHPKKCFSRISNTKILRFTETEPRTLLGNQPLAHHHTVESFS